MPYRFLRFPGGKCKAVTLSYDDGAPQDMKLMEILNRYGLKCTFNINSSRMLAGKGISVNQARQMLASGHEIAVHGAEHLANGLLSPLDGIREVLHCREELEQAFGMIIRGMAYPDSGITCFANTAEYENIRRYLKDLGIAYSRTLKGDNDSFELPADWHAWMPTCHHANPKLAEYMESFLNIDLETQYVSRRYSRLFYIWGHSFEFDRQDNWDVLDRIGETLGGREDIWYATNIEIYDYVNAWNQLIRSADGKIVYNPTVTDIWFAEVSAAMEMKEYCIHAGETLHNG